MLGKPLRSFGIGQFINEESKGGVLLILSTIAALVWANSAWHDSYHYLWHELQIGYIWGKINTVASVHHWINEGLMALFFFTVGLEIKREILGGELSSFKKASLPIFAAIGGMVAPALVYVGIAASNPEFLNGWGIPMATDIAFALALLAMLGKRVPITLKIFLTALAIADDLGAVLVIAFFYTESISIMDLLYGFMFLAVLILGNYLGIRRALFYGIIGFFGIWTAFLFSGVHATIAGILIAFTIPARTKISELDYVEKLTQLTQKFQSQKKEGRTLLTKDQVHTITDIESLNEKAHTPLQRLEHTFHPITNFIILPLFALCNAGVHIEGNIIDMLLHPISIGIGAGLLAGKFVGISLFTKLIVRLKVASLPEGMKWGHIYGASFLAGIGFTMSMFISDLAFTVDEHKEIAKVGIMISSLASAVVGISILASMKPPEKDIDYDDLQ